MRSSVKNWWWLLSGGILVSVALILLLLGLPSESVPTFAQVRDAYQPSEKALVDRHGVLLHEVRVDMHVRRLSWTPLASISPALLSTVVRAEDRRFFTHTGVDWYAAGAVLGRSLAGARLRGASTISMQVANLLERQVKSKQFVRRWPTLTAFAEPWGKWRQMRRAWALERQWSKEQILEAYLNLAPFRGELEGVAAASYILLHKNPHGVTAAEAAGLVALLPAPNAALETLQRRARRIAQMLPSTFALEETDRVVAQIVHAPMASGLGTMLAPHAAQRLFREAPATSPVHSPLDARLQRLALDSLHRHLLELRDQRVEDGAVLVVDNATGEVLAYVGSSGNLSSAAYVDGVIARRQAGSTLKPFLYGLAFEQRLLTPASFIEDTPLALAVAGGVYRPQNYDEHFQGVVSARTALAASLNIPAVRILALVGPEPFVQRLRASGFQGLTESGDFYGPSLALGSAEVSLWELTNAYRTLANGGAWRPLRMEMGSHDDLRNLLSDGQRVYTEGSSFLVSHILADRESRSVTFGWENALATRFWSAVKTGTSKDMRDNWCIGYSQQYTVGVWVGNFSGAPMKNVSGVAGAAPIWAEMMARLHQNSAQQAPAVPTDVVALRINFAPASEAPREEWFLRGTEPVGTGERLAREQTRILSPQEGAIIALDPDIPPAYQHVALEAQGVPAGAYWELDGNTLGSATRAHLWRPVPGKHALRLMDVHRQTLETVQFVVRGDGKRRE